LIGDKYFSLKLSHLFLHFFRVHLAFSCGTEEQTIEVNLGADKHSLHLGTRTLVAKSDSTSSRSATAENQVTPLEFLNSGNTKVQKDAFTSLTSRMIVIIF
jgi:hypothetical protein